MILNYEFHKNINTAKLPLIFIHGLFGSLSNLGMLARVFSETHKVIQLDVRNHGKSEHASEMNYAEMAQDVLETMDHLNIAKFNLVGHSMGGKIAMQLAAAVPERVEKLAVLDIAPYAYQQNHHDQIFKALLAVENANIASRSEAIAIMKQFIHEDMVIQFLLKSFNKGQWLFNVQSLYEHYPEILGWKTHSIFSKPALFLRGGNSPYVREQVQVDAIYTQFPNAEILEIQGAGHWLHAEKTEEVLHALRQYF
ncbi:alpha/beta fold hydrolase [Acinetobacter tianfuensis]|uniref:Alpha/beta fold hydrolase n=1 Tax=Acinetobacter tianfuensis TaxID=2419603 RepID=A0A3A8E3W9_9GAMM|nr:alpha/beta fold hydrolase [Acinetobacter tianfuensis]RKG29627.1 alpha/beta fold hydrolase [Acinetobacter tianfuensis]